jgi:hypothetical protein
VYERAREPTQPVRERRVPHFGPKPRIATIISSTKSKIKKPKKRRRLNRTPLIVSVLEPRASSSVPAAAADHQSGHRRVVVSTTTAAVAPYSVDGPTAGTHGCAQRARRFKRAGGPARGPTRNIGSPTAPDSDPLQYAAQDRRRLERLAPQTLGTRIAAFWDRARTAVGRGAYKPCVPPFFLSLFLWFGSYMLIVFARRGVHFIHNFFFLELLSCVPVFRCAGGFIERW